MVYNLDFNLFVFFSNYKNNVFKHSFFKLLTEVKKCQEFLVVPEHLVLIHIVLYSRKLIDD